MKCIKLLITFLESDIIIFSDLYDGVKWTLSYAELIEDWLG
jgi:hypothetical protein